MINIILNGDKNSIEFYMGLNLMALIFANKGYPIKADGLFNNVKNYFEDKSDSYEKFLFYAFYGNYL